jgi:hypothetical protein
MRKSSAKELIARFLRNPKMKAVLLELGKDSLIAGTTWLGIQSQSSDASSAATEFAEAIAQTSTYGEIIGALTTALAAAKSDKHAMALINEAEGAAGSDVAAQEFVGSIRDAYYRSRNTGDGQPGLIDGEPAPKAVASYREMQVNVACVKRAASMLGMSLKHFQMLRRAIHMDEDAFQAVLAVSEG